MKKKLFMETTEIESYKTAGEITSILVQAGAAQIAQEYGPDKEICGLRFSLKVNGNFWMVVLPARVEPIFKIINGRREAYGQFSKRNMEAKDRQQAKRIAWRQLLRWCEAQLAMVDAGMVQAGEVFLPYVEVAPGVTFFEQVTTDPARLLPKQAEPQAPENPAKVLDAEFVS